MGDTVGGTSASARLAAAVPGWRRELVLVGVLAAASTVIGVVLRVHPTAAASPWAWGSFLPAAVAAGFAVAGMVRNRRRRRAWKDTTFDTLGITRATRLREEIVAGRVPPERRELAMHAVFVEGEGLRLGMWAAFAQTGALLPRQAGDDLLGLWTAVLVVMTVVALSAAVGLGRADRRADELLAGHEAPVVGPR